MIIIVGMAGAGKSTQCRHLEESGEFQWFSVGQLLRSTESGDAHADMMMGKVLDNSIVTPLVRDEIHRRTDSPEILLDGCPRTQEQAVWLAGAVDTPPVRMVLHLIISDDVAIQRLIRRGREDDTEEAMRVRIAGYHKDIEPVIAQFTSAGIDVINIDAEKDEFTVLEEIKKRISQ